MGCTLNKIRQKVGTRKIKIIHKQFKFKIEIAYVDPWDMLNNFCFHVYAQKLLFVGENGNGFSGHQPPPHSVFV